MRYYTSWISFTILFLILFGCKKENNPPICYIIYPEEDAEFEVGAVINISVDAKDSDGSIESVTIKIIKKEYAVLYEKPYNFLWNTANEFSSQSYFIEAIAFDNLGAFTSDFVWIKLLPVAPSLLNVYISDVDFNSITCQSSITNDGGQYVSSRGFICDTIKDSDYFSYTARNECGTGTGEFSCKISNLISNTTYYIKPYAINSTGISYGQTILVKTLRYWSEMGLFTDTRDDQSYKWVHLGDQTWMAENLKYMLHVSPGDISNGIWVYDYQGDNVNDAKQTQNYSIYGCLYNWDMARNVCPSGWQLPTESQWNQLINYLGEEAGNKLRSSNFWDHDSYSVLNESVFSALPSGRRDILGDFEWIGEETGFWSISEQSIYSAKTYELSSYSSNVYVGQMRKEYGLSVRCIKK